MIHAVLFGSLGRMGCLVKQEARNRIDITAEYDLISPALQADTPLPANTEVVIDFSSPEAWQDLNRLLEPSTVALVTGTTGTGPGGEIMIEKWCSERAVFRAANMSRGIYVLGKLLGQAADLLEKDFDLEIVETHHRGKVDSPSGTALGLLEIWNTGRSGYSALYGREGSVGPRDPLEVGVHSIRGGDVPGDHELHLLGNGERLLLAHRAGGRRTFAAGAVVAAEWIVKRPPGLYGMGDMMGTDK